MLNKLVENTDVRDDSYLMTGFVISVRICDSLHNVIKQPGRFI